MKKTALKNLTDKEFSNLTKINIKHFKKHRGLIEEIFLLPKFDLHLHIGGSMRVSTIIDLAKKQNFKLPSYNENVLSKLVSKDKFVDLSDYLKVFSEITEPLLQEEEALQRAAYELAVDLAEENLWYFELRFAPMNYTKKGLRPHQVIKAVNCGLEQAEKETGIKSGIIICAVRIFKKEMSPYHKKMSRYFSSFSEKQLAQEVARNTAVLAINCRRVDKIKRVCGFDLAGPEKRYPAKNFIEPYRMIKKAGLYSTCHAGEDYGWQSIKQAIVDCGVERIGHGTNLLDNPQLTEYFKGMRRIPIEVCVTSNIQTCAAMKSIKDHPVSKFLKHNLRVCLCQDNRLISRTTKTKEIFLTAIHNSLTMRQIQQLEINALKSAFMDSEDRVNMIRNYLKTIKAKSIIN